MLTCVKSLRRSSFYRFSRNEYIKSLLCQDFINIEVTPGPSPSHNPLLQLPGRDFLKCFLIIYIFHVLCIECWRSAVRGNPLKMNRTSAQIVTQDSGLHLSSSVTTRDRKLGIIRFQNKGGG